MNVTIVNDTYAAWSIKQYVLVQKRGLSWHPTQIHWIISCDPLNVDVFMPLSNEDQMGLNL